VDVYERILREGWEWVREALEKLQGVEPYEVSQVLAAERRWRGIDVENLTFVDEPVPELPPPGADVMVVNSSRIPVELDQWIKRTADHRGVKESVIVRELLELGRSAYEGADRAVTLAEVMAALASIRTRDAV
jgi:predicted DNA-binding protein